MKKIKFFGIFLFILSSLVFLVSCGYEEASIIDDSTISQSSEAMPSSETESEPQKASLMEFAEFNLSDDGKSILSLTDYGKNQSNITIPDGIISIEREAFYSCSKLTSIIIPDSVINIGSAAFLNCNNLTSITIPNSVKFIGDNAFSECYKLVEVINKSSLYITYSSIWYSNDISVKQVISDESESKLSTDSNGFITYNDGTDIWLVNYIGNNAKIIIPSNVTKIGDYAFYNCISLTSITIPDTITSIGNNAFSGCNRLVEVVNKSSLNVTESSILRLHNISVKQIISDESKSKLSKDSNGFITYNDGTDIWLVNYVGNVTEITIPSNVTKINRNSFYDCINLTKVVIPDSVTSIGNYAFSGCTRLVEVINQSSLSLELGSSNYGGIARYAKQVISDESESKLSTDLNGFITYNDGTDIWLVNYIGTDTEITIPSNVTKINNYAFYGCINLTSITIPDTVTSIGKNAFSGCNNLIYNKYDNAYYLGNLENLRLCLVKFNDYNIDSFVVCNKTKIIYDKSFDQCSNLTRIEIPTSITSIGEYAFEECYKLVEVINKSSLSLELGSTSNGYVAYYAKQIISDESETKVSKDSNGFITYDDGTDIWLVNYIGNDTKITIPSNVTKINDEAFYGCLNITSVTVPNSVISIGFCAFFNCYKLVEVINKSSLDITKGSTSNGNIAYYAKQIISDENKSKLSTDTNGFITYNDGTDIWLVDYMGNDTEITIPSNVTRINDYTFYGCHNLTSVTIPEGVTSIGASAFADCESLTYITIPDTVTSIGYYAFGGCINLTYNKYDNVYYLGNIDNPRLCLVRFNDYDIDSFDIFNKTKIVYDSAFYECSNLKSIIISNSVISIGNSAFAFCYNLTSIIIPDSVVSIGNSAFACCYKLVEIINKSSLSLELGSYNYGNIAYYAKQVISDESESKLSKVSNGFITYNDGTDIWLVNYIGNDTEITIPSNVTRINDYVFYNYSKLINVTIPDSVISIGYSVFNGCPIEVATIPAIACNKIPSSKLKEVTITSGDSIADYAFKNCIFLTTVTISDTVKSIGNWVFSGCELLKFITIGNGIKSMGNYAFSGNPIEVATIPAIACNKIPSSKLKEVTITSGDSIADYAFQNSISLTSVIMPNTITSIGNEAFIGCTSLTTIIISNSVTSIGDYAFSGCTSLTTITIPNSATSIGDYAFYNCRSLIRITMGNSVTIIGDSAFSNCFRLVEVINKSALNIVKGSYEYGHVAYYAKQVISDESESKIISTDSNGFITYNDGTDIWLVDYKGNDTEITIPSNVTRINDYTFYGCHNLNSVTIPEGVTSIGYEAFENCTLTSITISNSVTSIGNSAFNSCYRLVEVINKTALLFEIGSSNYGGIARYAKQIISDESESKLSTDSNGFITYNDGTDIWLVNYIGNNAKIIIPSNVTKIGDYAFYNCINLTSITIPDTVTSIGDHAFAFCKSLKIITIPDSVTSMGNSTFRECSELTTATIGDNVTSIGDSAFSGCYILSNVIIGDSVTRIGDSAFSACYKLDNIVIPNIVISIGNRAFNGCSSLTIIIIPDSVTSIGDSAFEACTSLESITISDSIISIGSSAFSNCDNLTSIKIPDGVETIGYEIFYSCDNLKSIEISSIVTSIGKGSFKSCYNLEKVFYKGTSPYTDTITSIGSYNEYLINATWYYFTSNGASETKSGNWWYYDTDGETIIEKVIE